MQCTNTDYLRRALGRFFDIYKEISKTFIDLRQGEWEQEALVSKNIDQVPYGKGLINMRLPDPLCTVAASRPAMRALRLI